ncbi:hypothetical protein CBS101457_001070 [Exobasidium rhododendri]|nr:hypothetical protein CBS101457_001070 [Exobasidium rhododendri]
MALSKGLHGYYFVAPIIAFAMWLTDVVGLLGLWAHDGFPRYQRSDASIVFISDVGAAHQTFFIIFSSLSAAFYLLTVFLERHLRHLRRIPGSLRKHQSVLDYFSVFFAIIGAIALIILSVYNDVDHSTVHWSMAVVFVVAVAISVLLQTLEIFSLSASHERYLWHLKASAITKSTLLVVAVIAIVVFIGTYADCDGNAYPGDNKCDKIVSAAGVAEWVMAFILSFFFLTYIVDFWPAKKRADAGLTEKGDMVYDPARAEAAGEGHRPMAPYAIARDMSPNHDAAAYNSMTSNTEAPSLNQYPMQEANNAHHIGRAV